MNIGELSDSSAEIVIKKHRKSRLPLLIIAVCLLAGLAVGGAMLYRSHLKRQYIDSIVTSKLLTLYEDDGSSKMYRGSDAATDSDLIAVLTTKGGEFSDKSGQLQLQIFQHDVSKKGEGDVIGYRISCIYRYRPGDDPVYEAQVTELLPPQVSTDTSSPGAGGLITFTPGLEKKKSYIRGEDGSPLNEEEQRAFADRYMSDIKSLWNRLFELFGQEHFKK
ncbi:MAG: hypothetical protein IJ561_06065 [Ruminococcus sp.]|nr:hypothetical protein [Ruminococcus sp.]